IVGEVVPGITVVAVVLAHGSPLTLAQVGPPTFPGGVPSTFFVEARVLSRGWMGRVRCGHGYLQMWRCPDRRHELGIGCRAGRQEEPRQDRSRGPVESPAHPASMEAPGCVY